MSPLSYPGMGPSALAPTLSPEGPTGSLGGAAGGATDVQGMIAANEASQMEMLGIQMRVTGDQNSFTTLSNVIKSGSDAEKSAIANIK
jgi:hypothetical protein